MIVDVIIPIKGHSERVPNKNFRDLGGKLLYKHILDTLSQSKNIGKIYIDTDSRSKLDVEQYKKVEIIDRAEELIGDMVSVNAIIEHDLKTIESDIILQTHVTNPFLTTTTIDKAITTFLRAPYHSLFSVTELHKRFWTETCEPINHNIDELLRTQDLKPIYEDNSCMYLFTKGFFNTYKTRVNNLSNMFIIDVKEALDIDTEFDWDIAKCICKRSY